VCLFSTSTHAQSHEYNGNCKFIGDSDIFEHCLKKELATYDNELNNLYKTYFKNTSNERLKKVELLWVKFKEADCNFMAYEVNEGKEYSAILNVCLINKTKTRIQDLKRPFSYKEWFGYD
jgi:uncharacterized protein YecT (DUF1311 family)